MYKYMFFKIKKEKQGYKGIRYFRMNHNSDFVLQVVVHPGEERGRGKNATVGVYFITRLTFLSNYFAFYVDACTKSEFEKNFNKTVKVLSNKESK